MNEADLSWARAKVRNLLLELACGMREEAITALEAALRLEAR